MKMCDVTHYPALLLRGWTPSRFLAIFFHPAGTASNKAQQLLFLAHRGPNAGQGRSWWRRGGGGSGNGRTRKDVGGQECGSFRLTAYVKVKCTHELARLELHRAAKVHGIGHMSWDFCLEFLVVGQRIYLCGTLYSFLSNTFLALCTRHIYNQHALFLAAWIRSFETALVANSREMYFNYTLDNKEGQ